MPIIGTFTGSTSFGRSGGAGKVVATGGTTYTSGDYTIHAFTYTGSSQTFSVTAAPAGTQAEIVVIGGGGGGNGGYGSGGGGGAGGLTYMPPSTLQISSGNSFTVTVGAGGAAGASDGDDTGNTANNHGRRGGDSTVVTVNNGTITGGGGGGGNQSFYYSSNFKDGLGFGASGGGGGDYWPPQRGGGTATRAAAFAGGYRLGVLATNGAYHYGYNGGSRDVENGSHEAPHEGSGGGGAAGMPMMYGAGWGSNRASSGGRGLYLPQYDISGLGSPTGWFAGGGGGGYYYNGGPFWTTKTNATNEGGYFGGGGQGRAGGSGGGSAGVNGTGGGGGAGGGYAGVAAGTGPGGHGIVLVRYKSKGGSFASSGNGSSSSTPAKSAAHILAANPSATSGYYWIESYGVVKQVYCDMTNNGGGWMLMSYTGTSNSYGWHVLDNPYNYPSSLTGITTDPGASTAFNIGQLFIDGLVRRGRSAGIALFRIDGNMRYFPITSTAEWAPCQSRAGHNYHSQHSYAGNQWLKSCYTGYATGTGNGGAGDLSGTNVTWAGSTWGTFPYNMSNNDANNFGYSIDPQYDTYFHRGDANGNWLSCHSNGWNKTGAFWLKISSST